MSNSDEGHMYDQGQHPHPPLHDSLKFNDVPSTIRSSKSMKKTMSSDSPMYYVPLSPSVPPLHQISLTKLKRPSPSLNDQYVNRSKATIANEKPTINSHFQQHKKDHGATSNTQQRNKLLEDKLQSIDKAGTGKNQRSKGNLIVFRDDTDSKSILTGWSEKHLLKSDSSHNYRTNYQKKEPLLRKLSPIVMIRSINTPTNLKPNKLTSSYQSVASMDSRSRVKTSMKKKSKNVESKDEQHDVNYTTKLSTSYNKNNKNSIQKNMHKENNHQYENQKSQSLKSRKTDEKQNINSSPHQSLSNIRTKDAAVSSLPPVITIPSSNVSDGSISKNAKKKHDSHLLSSYYLQNDMSMITISDEIMELNEACDNSFIRNEKNKPEQLHVTYKSTHKNMPYFDEWLNIASTSPKNKAEVKGINKSPDTISTIGSASEYVSPHCNNLDLNHSRRKKISSPRSKKYSITTTITQNGETNSIISKSITSSKVFAEANKSNTRQLESKHYKSTSTLISEIFNKTDVATDSWQEWDDFVDRKDDVNGSNSSTYFSARSFPVEHSNRTCNEPKHVHDKIVTSHETVKCCDEETGTGDASDIWFDFPQENSFKELENNQKCGDGVVGKKCKSDDLQRSQNGVSLKPPSRFSKQGTNQINSSQSHNDAIISCQDSAWNINKDFDQSFPISKRGTNKINSSRSHFDAVSSCKDSTWNIDEVSHNFFPKFLLNTNIPNIEIPYDEADEKNSNKNNKFDFPSGSNSLQNDVKSEPKRYFYAPIINASIENEKPSSIPVSKEIIDKSNPNDTDRGQSSYEENLFYKEIPYDESDEKNSNKNNKFDFPSGSNSLQNDVKSEPKRYFYAPITNASIENEKPSSIPVSKEIIDKSTLNDTDRSQSSNEENLFLRLVATIVIQTFFRRHLAYKSAWERYSAVLVIQNFIRSVLIRRRFTEEIVRSSTWRLYDIAATQIQATFRGWWVRDCLGVDNYCASLIQRTFRSYLARSDFRFKIFCLTIIQSVARRYLVRLRSRRNTAAIKIQSLWRSFDAQITFLHTLADILLIQSVCRRYLVRKKLRKEFELLFVQKYKTNRIQLMNETFLIDEATDTSFDFETFRKWKDRQEI